MIVLTFVRTGELRAARWSEFDDLTGTEPLWRIPAERMKMKREHFVPLAPQVVTLLRQLRASPASEASRFLFPSPAREGCMSYNTMLYALYRMGYHSRATVHGFRAVASTTLNEMGFRSDVIERQLAHEERDAVRAAYNQAEYLAERRVMMSYWADWIEALEEAEGGCFPYGGLLRRKACHTQPVREKSPKRRWPMWLGRQGGRRLWTW
jgi:integrase